jgi:hypothetical protein
MCVTHSLSATAVAAAAVVLPGGGKVVADWAKCGGIESNCPASSCRDAKWEVRGRCASISWLET